MQKAFKDIFKVAFATLGSRVLGLVRDSASMAFLGMGAVSAAYTFAFTFPNLFRRLLGEGALTSAMIPTISQALKNGDKPAAFDFLNKTLTRAGILFSLIVFACATLAIIAGFSLTGEERFILGAKYSAILMPYMLMICLAAIFSAALNVLGSFGVPSVGPAVLNVCIISSIFVGYTISGADARAIATYMCLGWLIGGALQLLIPALYLRKLGWSFKFDLGKSPLLGELYALFLPACAAAAVIQINILVSKLLALFVNDSAIPALYISSRLIELPLGVFTIAIATVYFPILARLKTEEDAQGYKREYSRGLVMTMCISTPAAAGLAVLGHDILRLLFEWGIFNSKDIQTCLPVLMVSCIALPFYALSTFATRGFHSSKDMRTPMRVSCWVLTINLLCSLALMFKFGAVGLAGANTIAAVAQAIMLNVLLRKSLGKFGTEFELVKIVLASALMIILAWSAREFLNIYFDGKIFSICTCATVIPLSILVYALTLKLLKFKQFSELKTFLKNRR